jgi:hypothetical protein
MSCSYQGTEGDVIGYRRGKAPSLGRTERGMEGMGGTREMIRAYTKSQTSCPRVLHNRLWRFPFKPPALLGVIGSSAPAPESSAASSCGSASVPSAARCTRFWRVRPRGQERPSPALRPQRRSPQAWPSSPLLYQSPDNWPLAHGRGARPRLLGAQLAPGRIGRRVADRPRARKLSE